ncbi:hypothetical protein OJ923_01695 [Streptococcus anginosus]|uniref:Uncharacterized protein n=1 Tax=Streptococcus anginosus TaxID=1328 RepID=A0AAP6BPR8_STRAP|nr:MULTISPECIES: hypothetical protein [Streptococcus]ALL03670.1 hypothetical protein SanJ4211_1583c [Streptococcus anginosus]MCW1035343.1 hypothetical protein [Streptococcus anginosus]MDK8091551.1 hypothetical protein [Streptococcus intermedius]MDX5040394.1 hypothetical protein [Streptococcus anginosus]
MRYTLHGSSADSSGKNLAYGLLISGGNRPPPARRPFEPRKEKNL